MVSVLNSGASRPGSSPSQGHCVVFLGKTLYTLTVPLSTQVYKWVPANCWGNLHVTNCGEVTCDGLASCPGEVEILLVASCYRNRDKLRQLWAILGSKASCSHILACLFVVISGDTPFYADSLVGTYGECMYGLLTKFVRSRWLDIGLVLFCVFMDRDEVEVHKLAKKRTRPISSHLDWTNLVNKGFIIWLLGKFCLRDTVGSPEWARSLHLARSGSQSHLAISFILPARGASHIISTIICSGLVLSCYAMSSCW